MKIKQILVTVMIASTTLISCGNSIESDAKKVAEINCKAVQVMKNGDINQYKKLLSEVNSLTDEMYKNYTSEDEKLELSQAILKEMANCK